MHVLTPWELLRSRVQNMPGLYQPVQAGSCCVCRGPVQPGYRRCYQCEQHEFLGAGLLADAVVPISYAVRGSAFAGDLWRYKSGRASPATLLALLLVFLHDHGDCVWHYAGMPAPDHLAVVPSGCGRTGAHPLLRLVAPYLRLPQAGLVMRQGKPGRFLSVDRFAADSAAGANVLLLDDSWVSGASVQSATVALKLAGARRVAAVVLGRHLNPAQPGAVALATEPYAPADCAVHTVNSTWDTAENS
jgi:hypothetical protein